MNRTLYKNMCLCHFHQCFLVNVLEVAGLLGKFLNHSDAPMTYSYSCLSLPLLVILVSGNLYSNYFSEMSVDLFLSAGIATSFSRRAFLMCLFSKTLKILQLPGFIIEIFIKAFSSCLFLKIFKIRQLPSFGQSVYCLQQIKI